MASLEPLSGGSLESTHLSVVTYTPSWPCQTVLPRKFPGGTDTRLPEVGLSGAVPAVPLASARHQMVTASEEKRLAPLLAGRSRDQAGPEYDRLNGQNFF
jgi:hypothetical protein